MKIAIMKTRKRSVKERYQTSFIYSVIYTGREKSVGDQKMNYLFYKELEKTLISVRDLRCSVIHILQYV